MNVLNEPSGAYFSDDMKFRYLLWRRWNDGELLGFLMLNPSTANQKDNDPTISKCIKYARIENFYGIVVANLFAFRSPNPEKLYLAKDPIGPLNDIWLKVFSNICSKIILAYGNHGKFNDRDKEVLQKLSLDKLFYLKKNTNGTFSHPLYLNLNSPFLKVNKSELP